MLILHTTSQARAHGQELLQIGRAPRRARYVKRQQPGDHKEAFIVDK